jgi:hypothetical protein
VTLLLFCNELFVSRWSSIEIYLDEEQNFFIIFQYVMMSNMHIVLHHQIRLRPRSEKVEQAIKNVHDRLKVEQAIKNVHDRLKPKGLNLYTKPRDGVFSIFA